MALCASNDGLTAGIEGTELMERMSLKVERPMVTLRKLALDRMRKAIFEGVFEPGARLVERDLCDKLGVSRSVVREVIRHLEAEGLVDPVPNQGPVVATIDEDAAAQIYEIRAMLEAAAARACAEHATDADIAALSDAMTAIDASFAAHDPVGVLAATTRFYELMFLAGGKTVAWGMVQQLNGRISRLRAMTISQPGREVSGPGEMHRIFEAIRERKADAAADACRVHVERAGRLAAALLAGR